MHEQAEEASDLACLGGDGNSRYFAGYLGVGCHVASGMYSTWLSAWSEVELEGGGCMRYPNLDAEIAAYLRRTGKTQAELASEMGMSENTFSWKRRGCMKREFTLSEASKLAQLMGKSLDYLAGRDGAVA